MNYDLQVPGSRGLYHLVYLCNLLTSKEVLDI